jgi:hypothetical protein
MLISIIEFTGGVCRKNAVATVKNSYGKPVGDS